MAVVNFIERDLAIGLVKQLFLVCSISKGGFKKEVDYVSPLALQSVPEGVALRISLQGLILLDYFGEMKKKTEGPKGGPGGS